MTAAHEYNHVLQYATTLPGRLDVRVDGDLGRGEGLSRVNDYVHYLSVGASPDSRSRVAKGDGELKKYGSAIWNHWLEAPFGAKTSSAMHGQ